MTFGCDGSTAIEFWEELPTTQVAKVALAVGAVLTPVIIDIKLANREKIIKRKVA